VAFAQLFPFGGLLNGGNCSRSLVITTIITEPTIIDYCFVHPNKARLSVALKLTRARGVPEVP
jgi:hypothetical protein